MQPVNFPRSSFTCSTEHQFSTNPLTLNTRVNRGVQQKTVNSPIPGHFDKADQLFGVLEKSTNIKQAALEGKLEVYLHMLEPCTPEKRIEVVVKHLRVDFIKDGFQRFYLPICWVKVSFTNLITLAFKKGNRVRLLLPKRGVCG